MAQILCNISFNLKINPVNPEDIFNKAIENDAPDKFFLIVPTGRLERYLKQSFIRKYFAIHQKPMSEINIFTFQKFVHYCFSKETKDRGFRQISEAYRLVLFEEAIENSSLEYFSSGSGKVSPAIIKRLADVVYGLKEDGILVENLEYDLSNPENYIEIPKLRDIKKIFEEYQKLLGDRLADDAEVLSLLNGLFQYDYLTEKGKEKLGFGDLEQTEKLPDRIFNINQEILFYGFSEFKKPEIEFISHFSNSKIPVSINIDYSNDNGPLFGNLDDALTQLTISGFRLLNIIDEKQYCSADEMPLQEFIRRWLFNTEKEIRNNNFSDFIKIVAAQNRNDEVKSIARLVKYLTITEKFTLSDICIVMRNPEKYTDKFRDCMYLFGIPANITDRFHLSKSPVITSIFALLNVIINEYKLPDVHKALLSPYLEFITDDRKIDGLNLFDTASRLRISGGRRFGGPAFWFRRFNQYIESTSKKLEFLEADSSAELFEIFKTKENLISTQMALVDFRALTSLLNMNTRFLTPDEFTRFIKREIIEKFGIKKKLLEFYNLVSDKSSGLTKKEFIELTEFIEKDGRALSAFVSILDEMTSILNERDNMKNTGSQTKYTLNDLSERLRTAVSGCRYQVREKQQYGVTVTSIEQIRGIPFKVLILCGAVDGEFPAKYHPETFLGKELPETEQKHSRSEKMLFYQFLTNASDKLDFTKKQIYITYPKSENSEELVRTPFIESLLKISTLEQDFRMIDIPELINSDKSNIYSPEPWIKAIAGRDEALSYAGDIIYMGNSELNEQIFSLKKTNREFREKLDYLTEFYKSRTEKPGEKSVYSEVKLTEAKKDAEKHPSIRPYSVTELETYYACPFKYYLRYVLKLPEPKEYDLSLTPLDAGSIIHSVLYRFYTGIRSSQTTQPGTVYPDKSGNQLPDISPVSLEPTRVRDYLEFLIEIARTEINSIRFEHPFFKIEEEKITGKTGKPGWLELWLRSEISRQQGKWQFKPALFELAFGTKGSNSKMPVIPAVKLTDNLSIQGKIDRVEILSDESGISILIADYKSSVSNQFKNPDILVGKTFQMPLYILAAKSILREYYSLNVKVAGGVYYSYKPVYNEKQKKYSSESFILVSPESHFSDYKTWRISKSRSSNTLEELQSILDKSIENAVAIIEKINNGIFPVEPVKSSCQNCKYMNICRINAREDFQVSAMNSENL